MGKFVYLLMVPYFRIYGEKANKPRVRAIIRSNDQILFVKNWLSLQRWSLPGGGVDKDESYVDAIQREVGEEVGIKVIKTPLDLGVFWSHEALAPYRIKLFLIDSETKPDIAVDGLEIFDYEWISISDFDSKINPRLKALITAALTAY